MHGGRPRQCGCPHETNLVQLLYAYRVSVPSLVSDCAGLQQEADSDLLR